MTKPPRVARRPSSRAAAAAAALALAACAEERAAPLPRAERYGVFRDLVVYRGAPTGAAGLFFLDRFETTREDWFRYLEATSGADRPPWGAGRPPAGTRYLPVTGVTLAEARRYAHWRFCRLPRFDEWRHAATGGGRYEYPWGDLFTAAWANCAELGLGAPTPVGTFESGRETDGGAYDLVGNVAEWTESIAGSWFAPPAGGGLWRGTAPRFADRLPAVRGALALRVWSVPGLPPPAGWLVAAWGDDLPRLVAGGHFRSFAQARVAPWPGILGGPGRTGWERAPPERGDTLGVRLACSPADLVAALLAEPQAPSAAEAEALRAFLRRPDVGTALAAALRRAPLRGGPLRPLLEDELRR